jgi:hypothetical protein
MEPWGLLAAIDLRDCDRERVADADSIRRFVPSVIEAIGMRAHGPLALERFGEGELSAGRRFSPSRRAPSPSTRMRSGTAASSTSSPAGGSPDLAAAMPSSISAAR